MMRARGVPTPAPIATARLFESWDEGEGKSEVENEAVGLVLVDVENDILDFALVVDGGAAKTEKRL